MYINKMILKEGVFNTIDCFSDMNLIYSKKNSCGKSTYFRYLFYALGYQIPSMKGVDYSNVNTELYLTEREKDFHIIRTTNEINVLTDDDSVKMIFSLPEEHNLLLGYIFDSDNIKVLNNIIGIMYVDQEKGWSLLNRGTVIGKIKFSIEELVAGLSDKDCGNLDEKKTTLKKNIKKYEAMQNINALRKEIYDNNNEIYISETEGELSSKISLINLKIRDIKEKIKIIDDGMKNEENFWRFIDSMHLNVKYEESLISVTRENVVFGLEQTEYLKARRNLLSTNMYDLLKEQNKIKNYLNEFYMSNSELNQSNSESQELLIDKMLATFAFDQQAVNRLLKKSHADLKQVNKEIKITLRTNNIFIQKIYNYVKAYAVRLKIEDSILERNDYIFTKDLKSFSGANLQKLVFAFKVAFLKVIEEVLGTKMIMVLDSPRGKELDNDNLKLIMNIVNEDLKDNQVFIGSIYKDFKFDKKIELSKRAIEDRN